MRTTRTHMRDFPMNLTVYAPREFPVANSCNANIRRSYAVEDTRNVVRETRLLSFNITQGQRNLPLELVGFYMRKSRVAKLRNESRDSIKTRVLHANLF